MIESMESAYSKLLVPYYKYLANGRPYEEANSSILDELKAGRYHFNTEGAMGVSPIGEPLVTGNETLYVGNTVLTNNTSITRKMKSESFTKKVTFTGTNRTVMGLKVGWKSSVKVIAKFLGNGVEGTVEIGGDFNFGRETSQTNSKVLTYTLPSQDILVPPHSRVEVTSVFNKVTCSGKVQLQSTVKGQDFITLCFNNCDDHIDKDGTFRYVPFDELAKIANIQQFRPNEKGSGEMRVMGIAEYT
ncbi:ETX/MTX2 family pore-forming toxin, partial [Clostridium botulinum]